MLSAEQLEQLSMRLDEPAVHLHRGLPLEIGARFVQAAAFASAHCVGVRRDDGGLAPGWLVVSEKSGDSEDEGHWESEVAHRAFAQVVENAAFWLRTKVDTKTKRQELRLVAAFADFVSQLVGTRPDVAVVTEAVWYCQESEATLAYATFTGSHLLLATQRAVTKRAAARVVELLDALVDLFGVQTGEPIETSTDEEALLAFVVLTFYDLVRAFESNQAPVAERDPLALRKRSEQLFEILNRQAWALPMVQAVERAVSTWGESTTAAPTATALLGFLRHRATRYLDKVVKSEAEQAPNAVPGLSDEWSLVGLLPAKPSATRRRPGK
jgi:hypothetical protein